MTPPEARRVAVRGAVQGVGFRPFVARLARALDLGGLVRNRGGDVEIEVEGAPAALDTFLARLRAEAPPHARIDATQAESAPAIGRSSFAIAESAAGSTGPDAPLDPGAAPLPDVLPDLATCEDCEREVLDPRERRAGHAFASCTACGPRFTITRALPYDRARTTMAAFALCAQCRREYEDPGDRRYHAQPLGCLDCGPRLVLLDAAGTALDEADPLAAAARALEAGAIVAIKGLGGFHLACDATREEAVHRLRVGKARPTQPFAVLFSDLAAVERACALDRAERSLLASAARPIVVCRRREQPDGPPLAGAVAPGLDLVGCLLPYTPLHHLLARAFGGRPLVLTSANRSGEPLAIDAGDVVERLAGVADRVLTHDRAIAVRCDDAVVRVVDGEALPVRRGRGYAPSTLGLPYALATPTLALGGHQKVAYAMGRGARAALGPHVGDLDAFDAVRVFGDAIAHGERLFGFAPARLVHDLHPDYGSTAYAGERAARVPAGQPPLATLAVQHHHAHMAACLAEHGRTAPAIGLVLDGAGLGTDGAIWGGEVLVGDLAKVRRAAHIAYVPLIGGDRAAREPWRMAAAHLAHAGADPGWVLDRAGVGVTERRVLDALLPSGAARARSAFAPPTSSAGRLFDAISAIAGLCYRASYEGEAATYLERAAREIWQAERAPVPRGCAAYASALGADEDRVTLGACAPGELLVIDPAPLCRAALRDAQRGATVGGSALRFHAGLADALVRACARIASETGITTVALSGGVFQNALLLAFVRDGLAHAGLEALVHRLVPPNDGGLALGQLAAAAALDAAASDAAALDADRLSASTHPAR